MFMSPCCTESGQVFLHHLNFPIKVMTDILKDKPSLAKSLKTHPVNELIIKDIKLAITS